MIQFRFYTVVWGCGKVVCSLSVVAKDDTSEILNNNLDYSPKQLNNI